MLEETIFMKIINSFGINNHLISSIVTKNKKNEKGEFFLSVLMKTGPVLLTQIYYEHFYKSRDIYIINTDIDDHVSNYAKHETTYNESYSWIL